MNKKIKNIILLSLLMSVVLYAIYIKVSISKSNKLYTLGYVTHSEPHARSGGSIGFRYLYNNEEYFNTHGFPYPLREGVSVSKNQYWIIEIPENNPNWAKMMFKIGPCDSLSWGKVYKNYTDVPCNSSVK